MSTRQADSREAIDAFEASQNQQPIWYKDVSTGEAVDPGDIAINRIDGRIDTTFKAPPLLTPDEEVQAAAYLTGLLERHEAAFPRLARTLINNPELLWLLPEISMMLQPAVDGTTNSWDLTAELMDSVTSTSLERSTYQFGAVGFGEGRSDPTQVQFWEDVGSIYEEGERALLAAELSQLSQLGANRVAALAMVWVRDKDMSNSDNQQQLLLNIHQWSFAQEQADLGHVGFFGFLDAGQEFIQGGVEAGIGQIINAVHGPEEAARRRWLTLGQQTAYIFGLRPPEEAGDWGAWRMVSGGVDAWGELGFDPFAYVAGAGAGFKAAKTIPIALKATRGARAASAARSALPKVFTGQARKVTGGRTARIIYSLRAKTIDELMAASVKNGVADEALKLIKANNFAAFSRRFPQWAKMPDDMFRTIRETVTSPEEFIETLKSGNLAELLNGGAKLDDLEKAAAEATERGARFIDELDGNSPRVFTVGGEGAETTVVASGKVGNYTVDEIAQMEALRNFGGTRGPVVGLVADDIFRGSTSATDEVLGTFTMGADKLTLRKASQGRATAQLGDATITRQPFRIGDLWYVTDSSGRIVGGYDGKILLGDVPGLMHTALGVAERAGESFLPRLMARAAESGANFTEDGARFLRKAISDRLTGRVAPRTGQLLNDARLPRDLALEIGQRRIALNSFNANHKTAFILADVPLRSKRVFAWSKIAGLAKGPGRFATGTRKFIARATPGRPGNNIEIFNNRKALVQLNDLFAHFGLEQNKIDDLLNEFIGLDLGQRQDWFWDVGMRAIGRETGVPAFENNLIQFYRGGGVRQYAASGTDMVVDAGGRAHRMPILPTQMSSKMPIPLDEIEQVFRRARSIGNRSKAARAMGFNGRGLGKTNTRRGQLVQRLRTALGDEAADMTDEQLWDMAFSLVSPTTGMDGRGMMSGRLMPVVGSVFDKTQSVFTKLMLVTRPIQWMWRVAILEEPIRAHLYNMPSLYTNPLQYMAAAREAHYISRLSGWARTNSDWGADVYRTLTVGQNKEGLVTKLTENGLLREIFTDGVEEISFFQMKNGIARYIQDATYGRTRLDKIDPIKKVGWAVRNRSTKIGRAEGMLKKLNLPNDFDFLVDAAEINMKVVSGYLGEVVGASDIKMYQWGQAMLESEAFTYGQVYAGKLVELVEDNYGRIAIRRLAASMAGETPGAGIDARAVLSSSNWELMRGDLAIRFPDVTNDLELATRYLDEVLDVEVRHLFEPFLVGKSGDEAADLLEGFAQSRKIDTVVDGRPAVFDLRGANYGGGSRAMGDWVAANRANTNVTMPAQLGAVSLDPRFMAHDSPGFLKRSSDWILQTFGERASQTFNRRPAWIREYSRWFDNYTKLGVPADIANGMANAHATKMVNYVFFNMDEAPHFAFKLNQKVPFFGATYEVMSAWSYKMPVAVGGTWPLGVGEFGRKFQRLIDGFVNLGFVTRTLEDDGTVTHTLNLVPAESSAASSNEAGRLLQGAGFKAVNTVESVIGTILGMEDGMALRSQGYRLAVGHPLNFQDFGILSFAQTNIGLNPLANLAVTTAAAMYPGAAGPERTVTVEGGETLIELATRLDLDVNELVSYNRSIFTDTENFGSYNLYNAIRAGIEDPSMVNMPGGLIIRLPDTGMYERVIKDIFQPFGDVDNLQEFGINFLPGAMRWGLAGLALQNQPTDEFYKGDLGGIFGGLLPSINRAQVSSQINESFMFLEAHDIVNGKGPFARILEKREEIEKLLAAGKEDEANALLSEVTLDEEDFLGAVQRTASESLILRSLTGQMLPTAPGHVRTEQQLIQSFWDTKDYADSLLIGEGKQTQLQNFKSIEELENFYEQVAAWLADATGDSARARFRENYPQLQAYLTPKTFYSEPLPDVNSYEQYQEQIESGEREPAPLHVTMYRAKSSAIQADHYNEYIAKYGSDPVQAAANALTDRLGWNALTDEKDQAYQALNMWDDMYGHVYSDWREENFTTDNWAQDEIVDRLNAVRDNLAITLELEDNFDFEFDLERVGGLNTALKASIAEISNALRGYQNFAEDNDFRNPYEKAINDYFTDVYVPYQESISALYDQLPEVADSEAQSLIYEQIKIFKNNIAGTSVFLGGDTTIPFPSPLDYSWSGKTNAEKEIKIQQWVTRPLQWIDQDQSRRIADAAPAAAAYLPTADADFRLYREWTLNKLRIDEMLEANEITTGQAGKLRKQLEADFRLAMVEGGRGKEVQFLDMTPYERLELAGVLPAALGIFGPQVRWYKDDLAAREESAGTKVGRLVVAPLYDEVERLFYSDRSIREAIQQLGINLQDDDTLDNIMPWLFFGHRAER